MSAAKVKAIVKQYEDGKLDFETARTKLHELPPESMREVLARATAARTRGRDMLVMVLADVGYPPALPAMRRWLDDTDIEGIALPAASALDAVADQRFKVSRFWRGHWGELPETLAALAAWWDSGVAEPQDEAQWLAAQLERRARDAAVVPPPSPELDAEARQSLYADTVALKTELGRLPLRMQHVLDIAAIRRALPIYTAYVPGDSTLGDALDLVERTFTTPLTSDQAAGYSARREQVRAATERCNTQAGYSKTYQRYRVPAAKAAAHVAQGVLYALDPTVNSRLQAMHFARNAIEYATGELDDVRAELDWQLAQVRSAG